MTQNRMATTAFQWSVTAVFVLWGFASRAPAQPVQAAKPISINGVYNGSYAGEQEPTKFKLSITQQDNGTLAGVFTLYRPDGSDTKAYTCDLTGFLHANGTFLLASGKWETPPPSGFEMKAVNGRFDPAGGNGAGQISGTIAGKMRDDPRPKFEAIRDADESAKLASAAAAKKAEGPPAVNAAPASPAAPPPRRPTGANPAAPAAAPVASGPAAINGVYTGEFRRSNGNVKLKLSIKSTDDGSLTALFTFDVPAHIGDSITYKLTGKYVAGAKEYGVGSSPFQFTTIEPVGSAAKDALDASKAQAVHVGITGPDSINGSLTGSRPQSGEFNCGWISATKDRTASADLDKAMAAQAAAAAAPAAAPVARLSSIDGVYNGTYTDATGTTKFKLTITQTGQGNLAGVATVYLPEGAAVKPYTYSLDGGDDARHNHFELYARDWDTVPPKNFEKTGFDGLFVADAAHNSAKILNWQPNQRLGPKFEATWDAGESADIKAAIAAQKAVGPPRIPPPSPQELAAKEAADAAAVTAHADALKNAPPKQLASKDLVRKSKAYWGAYENDMIRQVFDGGFGPDMDESRDFKVLFCTYVEIYSAKCAANLPADHQTVTMTQYTSRKFDNAGNLISQNSQTSTVEVDSRFVAKYRKFSEYLGSSKNGLGPALDIAARGLSPRQIVAEMLAPVHDMQRFFANHPGNSAAMRQLTENFLRAATGELSLQQADAKIQGAEAETDKGLPPGRFARFVDGANGFYRDPANAKYKSSHDTAFCQRLAQKYDRIMTREEEYYYANDFEARFYRQIMQPKEHCTDPAWPRLHPAVEECIAEMK
jgi:hypothetical protein